MQHTTQIPRHIAIICDGNRRWAKQHGLEIFRGHERAVKEVFATLIEHAQNIGVQFLTFWVFSTENWDRDEREVAYLMKLFEFTFEEYIEKAQRLNLQLRVLGDPSKLPSSLQKKMSRAQQEVRTNTGMTVGVALNYGGRDEIIRAIRKMKQAEQHGDFAMDQLTEKTFAQFLDTAGMPDPDLIIRTSGELRLSGFMSWQQQYSEFYFTQTPFPDFGPEQLDAAIADFQRRQRRFGKG